MRKVTSLVLALSTLCCLSAAAAAPRSLPGPDTVSPEMQAIIAAPNTYWDTPLNSAEDWFNFKDWIHAAQRQGSQAALDHYGITLTEDKIGGVPVYWMEPEEVGAGKEDKVLLFIHGGGYVLGQGLSILYEGAEMAGESGYRVLAVDYRLAPEFPYPAATDDALAVYKELLKTVKSENIAVFGSSTGGAMTLILAMQARDQGLPLPASLAALTPWTDVAKVGDTYYTNEYVDNSIVSWDGWLQAAVEVYCGKEDLKNPYISPVYGSVEGLPPTLLVSGTRDLFLSNTVRMHEKYLKAGVKSELIVYEGQSHVQYYAAWNVPETVFHFRNLTRFFDEHFGLKVPEQG